ncbi:MAG: hypothetical protein VX239_02605, partial [Candidatus Thermoplasmatota archaeon]|nr:hypothetical protein [Candidatus Thermoplasmatota archaeon]
MVAVPCATTGFTFSGALFTVVVDCPEGNRLARGWRLDSGNCLVVGGVGGGAAPNGISSSSNHHIAPIAV